MKDLKLEELLKRMNEREGDGENSETLTIDFFKDFLEIYFTDEALINAQEMVKQGNLYGSVHLILRNMCLKSIEKIKFETDIENIKLNTSTTNGYVTITLKGLRLKIEIIERELKVLEIQHRAISDSGQLSKFPNPQ